MTIANVNIKKVLFRRGNTIQNDNYVGVFGEVSVDTQANTLRVHNGVTAGGTRLATYAELTDLAVGNIDLTGYATTSQITAANVEIGKLRANITAANVAWAANAATQAAAINTINANLGSFQTYANATFTGGGGSNYSNTNVAAYLTGSISTGNIIPTTNAVFTLGNTTHWWKELYVGSNTIYIGGVPLSIDADQNLLIDGNVVQGGNVDAVNSNVSVIDANIGAYQRWANTNAASQTTSINTTNANIGAYQIWANANAANQSSSISAVGANVTAANSSIATTQANIGAYQIWANANAAAQTAAINLINANVAAANTSITTANIGMKSYVDAVTTAWTANAGTQQTQIDTLQTQVYSNTNTAAYLTGAITTGNITAANVTVETNAVVLGNLRVVGTQTTVNATTLSITDLWVTVADGATQASDANGAGLRVEGALANIAYSSVSDSFEFNKQIVVGNVKFSDTTRFSGNTVTLPNTQGFSWYFNDPMIGSDTVKLYMNELTTGYATWALTTGNGANSWYFDSDAQEFSLFNGGAGAKLVFGTAANAGVRSSIDDIELKSAVGNVYITANANPWTFSETGNLILPTRMNFSTSPAISGTGIVFGDGTYQYTAWDGVPGNELVNSIHTVSLDTTGNLNVPGDILPLVDNLHDLGSATQRFRHLYVGPGTVYVGNAAIKTTATGNLILPGLTRPIASTAYAEEVDEEDDQTQTFNSVPTVIDNAHYSYLNGNPDNLSFTPAEYSVDQLDGEGYIDGITVTSPGVGYAGQVESLAEQDMWATEVATPLASFNAGDWVRIPFRVRSRAGESEYDFIQGGGSVDRLVNDDQSVILGSDGYTTFSGTIVMGNGDAVIGQDGDDFVISWDNEALVLRAEQDDVQVQADRSFQIDTDYAGSYKRWVFDTNGYLVHTTGDTQVYSELGNLTLQGGAVGLGSGNVNIVAVETGVAVQTWAFGNDGVLTLPKFGTINFVDPVIGGFGTPNTTTRTPGNRIVLYPSFNGSGLVDYAIGIDGNVQWYSIPDSNATFEWYAGSNKVLSLSGSGHLTLPEGGDILDSNGQSVLGGGSGGGNIAGLTSTVGNQAGSHGSTVYSLTLNSGNDEDNPLIEVYKGTDDNNSAISIGQSNSGFRQANVIAIGNDDVGYDALPGGVYIGYQAGWNDTEDPQGLHAIAIGSKAAYYFATNNSITLNATGSELNPDESGLFIKPIREEQYDDAVLYYNVQSGEVTYATNTGGGASIGNTAPTAVNGRLWYNTDDGRTYVYALDTWIDASPSVVPGNMVGYDTDGNITLRDDASINYANGVSIINSVYGDAEVAEFLNAYTGNIAKIGSDPLSLTAANIELSSDNETWRFSSTGNIVFPDGSEQATAYTGGGSSYGNVELAAYLTDYEGNIYINSENSGLIIDAAGDKRVGFMKYFGIEASFVHANGPTKSIPFQIGRVAADDITRANNSVFTSEIYISNVGKVGINTTSPAYNLDVSGNVGVSGNLYIGGNLNYANGVSILSNLAVSTGNITFDGSDIIGPNSNGNITIQTTTGVPSGPVTKISDNQGWDENNVGTDLPTTGGTGTGLTVDVVDGGSFYSVITINNPGSGYTNGDVITVTRPSISETFSISVPVYNWTFGANGATTFPGNLSIQPNPNINGTVISQANAVVQLATTGTGITGIGWSEFENEPGGTAFANFNNTAGNIELSTGNYLTTVNTWTFGADGTITFPDTTVQTTAYTGNINTINGYINFTSSPAIGTSGITFADASHQTTAFTGLASNLRIGRAAPTVSTGGAGDLLGAVAADENYLYYAIDTYGNSSYYTTTATGNNGSVYYHDVVKGDYPRPQTDWTLNIGGAILSPIVSVTDGGTYWRITTNASTPYSSGQGVTLTGNSGTVWKSIPLTTFGTAAYGNTQVAAYLLENPQGSGTYSNANVVANLQNFVTAISTTANITTTANVIAPNYLFANGVNILSTVSAGSTYSNANVIAMYSANTYIGFGNVGTAYPTQANVTQMFVGNTTTIGAGSNQLGGTYILNNAYFGANGALYARNTQTGAAQFRVSGGSFDWAGTTGAVTANSVQSFGLWAGLNSSALTTYNSIGITSAGTVAVNGSGGITTTQTSFPLVNATATTISFGGAATTITAGATTVNVQVGGSTMRGNISAGNIVVGGNISAGNIALTSAITAATATTTGNVTALNFITTGTYGNITGANVISANSVSVTTFVRTVAVTFAELPDAAAAGAGARAFITDGNTATFGSQVSGGGANAVPVYSNGTNWYVG